MNRNECLAVCDKFALDNPDVNKDRLESVKDIIDELYFYKQYEEENEMNDVDISVFIKNNSSLFLGIHALYLCAEGTNEIARLFDISKHLEFEADKENADYIFELDVV